MCTLCIIQSLIQMKFALLAQPLSDRWFKPNYKPMRKKANVDRKLSQGYFGNSVLHGVINSYFLTDKNGNILCYLVKI